MKMIQNKKKIKGCECYYFQDFQNFILKSDKPYNRWIINKIKYYI